MTHHLGDRFSRIVKNMRARARYHGFKIKAVDGPTIYHDRADEDGASGYFDYNKKEIGIAMTAKPEQWVPVFVHEICHLQQWVHEREFYMHLIKRYDLYTKWIKNEVVLDEKAARELVRDVVLLEADCERKVIQTFKQYPETKLTTKELTVDANNHLYALGRSLYNKSVDYLEDNEKHELPTYFLEASDYLIPRVIKMYVQPVLMKTATT